MNFGPTVFHVLCLTCRQRFATTQRVPWPPHLDCEGERAPVPVDMPRYPDAARLEGETGR